MNDGLFAGGEIRLNSANPPTQPRPVPVSPPPKASTYRLSVSHGEIKAHAEAATMPPLLDLNEQLKALGYEFIKLERMD